MAYEVTKLVHGEEEALKVKKASEEIFGNKGNSDDTEKIEVDLNQFTDSINIIDLLMLTEMFESKSEARRMIQQNAIKINNERINDIDMSFNITDLKNANNYLIQKGKKNFRRLIFH